MIHLFGQEEAWPVPAWVGHLFSAKATTSLRSSQTVGHDPLEAGEGDLQEDSKGKPEVLEAAVITSLIAPA